MRKIENVTISIHKDFTKGTLRCSAAYQLDASGVRAVDAIALQESDCASIVDAIVGKVKARLAAPGDEVTFAEPPVDAAEELENDGN